MLGKPLFPGRSSIGQMEAIMRLMGTPTTEEWNAIGGNGPNAGPEFRCLLEPVQIAKPWQEMVPAFGREPEALNLLAKLLDYNPSTRSTPVQALCCRFLQSLPDEPGGLPASIFQFTAEEFSTCTPDLCDELLEYASRHGQQ